MPAADLTSASQSRILQQSDNEGQKSNEGEEKGQKKEGCFGSLVVWAPGRK